MHNQLKNNISSLRLKRGLSHQELATLINCTVDTLICCENTDIDLTSELAQRIAKALECTLLELVRDNFLSLPQEAHSKILWEAQSYLSKIQNKKIFTYWL